MIENFNLWYRTFRYRVKNDVGGMKFIKSSLKPGDTAFDIGAHKGGYLNFMRKCVGTEGFIVGFEPQLVLYRYLDSVRKSLNWKNVKVEHLALSDSGGKKKLFIPVNKIRQDSSPGASLLSSKSEGEISKIEEVTTQTLDNYIQLHQLKPVFLKIDVEGHELNVLKGASELLHSLKPGLLVEIEARHAGKDKLLETFEFLKGMKYRGKFIYKNEFIQLDKFTFAQYQNLEKMDAYCNNFIFE